MFFNIRKVTPKNGLFKLNKQQINSNSKQKLNNKDIEARETFPTFENCTDKLAYDVKNNGFSWRHSEVSLTSRSPYIRLLWYMHDVVMWNVVGRYFALHSMNKYSESIAQAIHVPYRPQQIFKRHYSYKYKKRLPLRCIRHFKSDLINNMDHMRISGTEPSSVILSQTK